MAIVNPRLKMGHTGITWPDENAEAGVKCIAELGFHNIEIFAWVLKRFYDQGQGDIFSRCHIPLISSYYSIDIVNPDLRESELMKLKNWTDIVSALGGKYATFGGNSVDRRVIRFNEHKKYIVDFVNEAAKILDEKGITLNFHPHTGTPIETESEIISFFDSIDTKYVGFAPDIGQIKKGGADPMYFIREYISIIRLVHFKDYCGNIQFDDEGKEIDSSGFACYSPLGQGVVNLQEILEYLEKSPFDGPVMTELDRGEKMPMTAEEAVKINKKFLQGLGYEFSRV